MNNYCFKICWLSGYMLWVLVFGVNSKTMATNRQHLMNQDCMQHLVAQHEWIRMSLLGSIKDIHLEDQLSVARVSGFDKGNQLILDEYNDIKDLYAYDPIAQKWLQIKDFQIVKAILQKKVINVDWTVYTDFWAYNHQREWFKVSLMKFLKQHYHDSAYKSIPVNKGNTHVLDRNSYKKEYGRKDFLEELLTTEPGKFGDKDKSSSCSKFSCYVGVGMGGLLVENKLKNMRLICRKDQEYFLSHNNTFYKPCWFEHILCKVENVNLGRPIYMDPHQANVDAGLFKAYGIALPLTFGLAYHINHRWLIGLGKEIMVNRVEQFHYYNKFKKECDVIASKPWFMQSRWFIQGGWHIVQYAKHAIMADMRLLWVHYVGDKWCQTIIPSVYLYQTIAYNLGLTYEQQLTDRLALTTRVVLEYKSFQEFNKSPSFNILYRQPAIYVQSGFSIKF